jgi:hypothetical protein
VPMMRATWALIVLTELFRSNIFSPGAKPYATLDTAAIDL